MKILPKARTADIVIQNLKDEVLIYNLKTNEAFCLNETSANVFNACDGATTFDELKTRHRYTDEIIYLALDGLKKENLLESDYVSPHSGLSRREIIRKVGLASMIALPIISRLIAPSAANAASGGGRATLAACSPAGGQGESTQCQSGNCYDTLSNGGNNTVPYYYTGNTKCCYPGANTGQRFDTGHSFGSFPSAPNCAAFGYGAACCSGSASQAGPGEQCLCT